MAKRQREHAVKERRDRKREKKLAAAADRRDEPGTSPDTQPEQQ